MNNNLLVASDDSNNVVPSSIPLPEFESPSCKNPPKELPLSRSKSLNFFRSSNEQIIPIMKISESVPRISSETLRDIIEGKYSDLNMKLIVVDCRFDYEFRGGHIKDALSAAKPNKLIEKLIRDPDEGAIVVFHCEFSSERAPKVAGFFRDIDREVNRVNYPKLYYPHVYILDGGYKKFYTDYPEHCEGGYIPMNHVDYKNTELQLSNTIFRNEIQDLIDKKRALIARSIRNNENGSLSPNSAQNPFNKRLTRLMASPTLCKK